MEGRISLPSADGGEVSADTGAKPLKPERGQHS